MKTRFLIIVGIATAGVITSFLLFPNEQQNTCEQMGGKWNTDQCMVTQEIIDSNKLVCDPGTVLENGTCYRNGIKLVFESILEPELSDIPPSQVIDDMNLNNQECARLFDKIFDTWKVHVKENYGGPGQPVLEPPSVSWLIADWEGGEEFRDSDCRHTVNDWANLVEHQEQVWGYVDWPKLEPFPYTEPEVIEERFQGIKKSQIEDIQLAELGCKKIGNQTYCDIMVQEKIDYYLQQNHGEKENETELNPVTKSVITVQDRPVNRTIVPITITEKTTNAQSLDTITQWNFSILGIEMSTLGDYWGNLPDQYITSEMVDQNGNDVLDYTRIPDGQIFYKLSQWYYPVSCEDGQKIKGEGGYPEPIPIKKGASDVFFNGGDIGLYPDDDGKYFFDFVSGFETKIEFHPNVNIISQETKKCNLEIERGNFTDMYYTNVVFSFED